MIIHSPQSNDMVAPLRPIYILYSYVKPSGMFREQSQVQGAACRNLSLTRNQGFQTPFMKEYSPFQHIYIYITNYRDPYDDLRYIPELRAFRSSVKYRERARTEARSKVSTVQAASS